MERHPEAPPHQDLPCLASCCSQSSLVPVAELCVFRSDKRGKEDPRCAALWLALPWSEQEMSNRMSDNRARPWNLTIAYNTLACEID